MTKSHKRKLIDELAALDFEEWHDVVHEAAFRRGEESQQAWFDKDPPPGTSRDDFAAYMARSHGRTDPGLREIYYLPAHCPPDELRLVEVNSLLVVPGEESSPVDYSPDIPGINFTVLGVDVSPEQWRQAKKGKLVVGDGWDVTDARLLWGKKQR